MDVCTCLCAACSANVRAEFMQTCVTGRFEVEKSDARSSW